MKPTMDLTGLPIDRAVAIVQKQIDRRFEYELKVTEARLIADGVRLQDREAMLDDERLQYSRRRLIIWKSCASGWRSVIPDFIERGKRTTSWLFAILRPRHAV